MRCRTCHGYVREEHEYWCEECEAAPFREGCWVDHRCDDAELEQPEEYLG